MNNSNDKSAALNSDAIEALINAILNEPIPEKEESKEEYSDCYGCNEDDYNESDVCEECESSHGFVIQGCTINVTINLISPIAIPEKKE